MSETVAVLIQLQSLDNAVAGGEAKITPYRKRKRQELLQRIPDLLARAYHRVRNRHSNAVVPVVDGVCQGCFVQLPVWVSALLENPREQVCCDHCGRILYLP